jgi:predicted acylesterase/phospholipase RssA
MESAATTGLVLSGGGTRCLVYGELLLLLENGGHLAHIERVWSTSAGALVGMLYLLCRSAARVKSLLWDLDFASFRNVNVSNLFNIMNTWAIDDGAAMLAGIERCMEAALPGSSTMLLRDLPGLHTIVADLTRGVTVAVSATNYPNLRVAEAVRASMSLPIIIRPYTSPEGHIWVDGGLRANFPWALVPEELRGTVLGLKFNRGERTSPRNFSDFIHSMVHFDEPKKELPAMYSRNILEIPTPPFPAWFLRPRAEDYELVTALARTSYDAWFSKQSTPADLAAAEGKAASVPKHAADSGGAEHPAVIASLTNVRLGDSGHPPRTSESQTPPAPPCTRPPFSPPHCTAESSGIPRACPAPSQDSSPRSPPLVAPPSRRWSL